MSNSINDFSPQIRDFLLKRNLIVADSISDNGLLASAKGLGLMANISENSESVLPSINLETSANDYRNSNVSRNRYISNDDMVSATIIDNSFSYSQVNGGYLNENREINVGGPSTDTLDIITSLTSQKGFSFSSGGIDSNNNIRNTVSGRILGGVGAINDTPLGIIAGQQLLLALGQNVAFKTQKELLGKVNLQPFSLLRGGSLLNPDYTISVDKTTKGSKLINAGLKLTGFEPPFSRIGTGASIFQDDSGFISESTLRNNELLKYTGEGQKIQLFELLNRNKFKPNYLNDDNEKVGVIEPKTYSSSGLTSDVFLINKSDSTKSGKFIDSDDIWSPSVDIIANESLLTKTKDLFANRDRYLGLFNLHGIYSNEDSQLTTPSGGKLSKGSGVLGETYFFGNERDEIFCRTWTSNKTYSSVADLQKNKGLIDYKNKIRRDIESSVLDDNGFVKITPYKTLSGEPNELDAKKFMFSIENLAWADDNSLNNLPEFEIGGGDPITGTKGRIMWFPPYDIQFDESTNVSWDKTSFIGRGEPIYTYNNTERSGTLSFKIIIDHPDYLNDNNSDFKSDEILASIAAGCLDYERYFSINEINQLQSEVNKDISLKDKVLSSKEPEIPGVKFYFANDRSTFLSGYEVTGGLNGGDTSSDFGQLYPNNSNYGLNDEWDLNQSQYIADLSDKLFITSKSYYIILRGHASIDGTSTRNQTLSEDRIKTVKQWLVDNFGSEIESRIIEAVAVGDTEHSINCITNSVDSKCKKQDRKVSLSYKYVPDADENIAKTENIKSEKTNFDKEMVSKIKRRFHRESEYFEKLKNSEVNSDKLIYKTIKEKIKFFQPGFHSVTPEGFNSRLTFLQQCTRQGPTIKSDKDGKLTNASNLAFGRPPVCILRIGDFYHTKIIINNLGITYEPLVWDLNPEGVGVQPRIAKISMSFNFIGGSSLRGPINELQNAVSFNYFANTSIYDPRSKSINKDKIDNDYTKNLRERLLDEELPTTKNTSEAPKDQQSISDVNNFGGAPVASAQTISDKDILSNVEWDVEYDVSLSTLKLNYNSGVGYDFSGLSKDYSISLQVEDPDTHAYVDVLTGVFKSTIENSFYISSKTWDLNTYGLNDNNYKLKILGHSIGIFHLTGRF